MISKRILFGFVILLLCELSYAIKPSRTYYHTPEALGLRLENLLLQTEDGASIKVWHLLSDGSSHSVIISGPDAGNMGDRLSLEAYLQSSGLDAKVVF